MRQVRVGNLPNVRCRPLVNFGGETSSVSAPSEMRGSVWWDPVSDESACYSRAALWPWPARTEATNWSVRVGCVYSGEACRTDQDRVDVGAYCPIHSMVREFYDYIIGDAPLWGDPVG